VTGKSFYFILFIKKKQEKRIDTLCVCVLGDPYTKTGGIMKFDETIPIYLQIKAEIEKAIISQNIAEESKIDSIRELAKFYQVNPQTISSAYNELLNDDILYKKRGIGTFVKSGARARLLKKKTEKYLEYDLKKILENGRDFGISLEKIIKIAKEVYQGGLE
jgi:DNA-binding transcriptional regulator YhcF (GntR family)